MEFEETDGQQPNEQAIAIYSKTAVLWFSIFFSPIAGGILLVLNLRSAGYKKEGTIVLLFSLAYYLVSRSLLAYINTSFKLSNINLLIFTLILDIIGGGVLAEYFFKKYFPDDDYESKSVIKPLVIILMITIPLSYIFMNFMPK